MAVTWNPADKDASITLSNGNLTAAQSLVGGSWLSVRATLGLATGKVFFELTLDLDGASSGIIFGLGNSTASLTTFPGGNTNGVGWQAKSGVTYYNGGLLTNTVDTVTQGQTCIVAADIANSLWWTYAPTAARWNGSGLANPITGVGGLLLHSVSPAFPMFSGFGEAGGDQGTANFGATSFVNSIVTTALIAGGWTSWGGNAGASSQAGMFFGL